MKTKYQATETASEVIRTDRTKCEAVSTGSEVINRQQDNGNKT